MNINKKLNRIKQWTNEKMGAEAKTGVSDEFKNLEIEMQLRHEGMQNLHKASTNYLKSLSKSTIDSDREKALPIGKLGLVMANHGDDFDPDSEFGNCLIGTGRANERIARHQESFVAGATGGWLEGLERSLAGMKEYQNARKKLETRRLAYDASLSRLHGSKGRGKDDFKLEEELRSQKAKYEESSEDVFRRMQDIKEAEEDSVRELGEFVDAELDYFERCADELRGLRQQWPAGQRKVQQHSGNVRVGRQRSNTAHSYKERLVAEESIPEYSEPQRPAIRSASTTTSRAPSASRLNSLQPQHSSYSSQYETTPQASPARPYISRAHTVQVPTPSRRDITPSGIGRMTIGERKNSFANDAASNNARGMLRPTTSRINTSNDVFQDPSDHSTMNSASPDRSPGGRSVSPATSHDSRNISRQGSYSNLLQKSNGGGNAQAQEGVGSGVGKKGPPPPPPSRSKKPPPPPPGKKGEMCN